jgi:hypothetical protein
LEDAKPAGTSFRAVAPLAGAAQAGALGAEPEIETNDSVGAPVTLGTAAVTDIASDELICAEAKLDSIDPATLPFCAVRRFSV